MRISFFPKEDLRIVKEKIEKEISASAEELGVQHFVSWDGFQAEGFSIDPKCEMMSTLGECFERVKGHPPSFSPITATTDARFFNLYYGVPATCLGPLAHNIHGIDESVDIQSILDVTKILVRFISEWCKLDKI